MLLLVSWEEEDRNENENVRTKENHNIKERVLLRNDTTEKAGWSRIVYCLYVTVCLYEFSYVRPAYLYAYRLVCILISLKSIKHVQIQSKCKILMLFLDQN
jgi:hypothetical protein